MRRELAILSKKLPAFRSGKWVDEETKIYVRVMARAEGHAMVRRPHAVPFVVLEKELEPVPITGHGSGCTDLPGAGASASPFAGTRRSKAQPD